MITDQDIQKLITAFKQYFPGLDDITTRRELAELREHFDSLQTTMDKVVVMFDKFQAEMLVINHRVTKLEKHTGLI